MKPKKLNIIIVLGLIATIGILIAQLLWTKEAFNLEDKKLSQRTHIALLEVVKKLYQGTNSELPSNNPIKKQANDYYIVNVENDFKPEILEFYLKQEFKKFNINTDFEYAMYNCQSDEMVYGNYISMTEKEPEKVEIYFPKHKNLIYYFAVRFPNENAFLLKSLRFWVLLSLTIIIILIVYVYSIYTIIQQKKYTDLQRDFINNMTHEFKTPLSSILIASTFLKQQIQIQNDDKLNKYTQIIINQSNKLNQHIEKVLHIAKSDSSNFELVKTELSLLTLLKSTIETIQLKHENCKIDVESSCDFFIFADEFHFSNLIYNLLENAVKYCEKSAQIHISIKKENNKIQLLFIDNGIGIDVDKIPFVFDKFYRISTHINNDNSGFGLGLYYVKKIVELHKWKISILNNEKTGVTITLIIPTI